MAGYIGSKIAVTQVDGYNRTEADAEFVQVTGDTMTGALTGTNLTLSGGVYLGGTGAANYLDDYEEGTYSAYMYDALSGGNFVSLGTGYYRKVGSLVTFHFRDSNINTSGLTGANPAYFSVPFASSSDFGGPCGHSLFRDVNWAGTQTAVSSYLGAGESAFRLYVQGDNVAYTSLKVSEFNSGAADIYFTGSYFSA